MDIPQLMLLLQEVSIDVTYTVNFVIYDGSSNVNWTAVYKVIGNGKFEYVEDSMKKVE